MKNEKKYVITESELLELLCCQMECTMNERDGVDNWGWYGTSRNDVIKEFYPGEEEPDEDVGFYETAVAILEAGGYPEQVDMQELFGNFILDYDTVRDYMSMD
jgi:hypothetical protein